MEKVNTLNKSIIAPLLEHTKKGEAMLFLSLMDCELMYQYTGLEYSQLKNIIKLAHFGTNKLIGEYLEDDPADMETLVLYGKKEREQELKNLAICIGKKFKLAGAMFVYSDGKVVYLKTREDAAPAPIGSEILAGAAITLELIEGYYAVREEGGFKVKSIGDAEMPL